MVTNRDKKAFGSRSKIPNIVRLSPLKFLIRVHAFRCPFCGELLHVKIYMNEGTNPLMLNDLLLSY